MTSPKFSLTADQKIGPKCLYFLRKRKWSITHVNPKLNRNVEVLRMIHVISAVAKFCIKDTVNSKLYNFQNKLLAVLVNE